MKKIFSFVLACVFALVSTGCSQAAQQQPDTTTVTDGYGRTVHVPKQVNAVATVGSGARFVVYAGGAEGVSKLVAVTDMETKPAMNKPYTIAYANTFSSLPSTNNGNHLVETNVNVEELIRMKPDVIISSRSAEECNQLQAQTNIPVVGIAYQNQLFGESTLASIQAVGKAIGTEDHANGVIQKMTEWQSDLKTRSDKAHASAVNAPTVYLGALNYKGSKGWGGTTAHYPPCDILGVANVADNSGQNGAFDASLEQIVAWNPQFMFLNAGNMDLLKPVYLENKALFNSLQAFTSHNVYTQPFYNYNGTNIGTGIADTYFIGSVVYPEAFSDLNMHDKYKEIYETMLGGFDFYQLMQEKNMGFTTFPSFN